MSTAALTAVFGCGVVALAAAAVADRPAGLVGVGLFYGLYRMVLVVADTRLQESITGSARATVTSMASLGSEGSALVLYAAWAIAGLPLVVVLIAVAEGVEIDRGHGLPLVVVLIAVVGAASLTPRPRWLRGRTRRPAVNAR